jgi:hypothetical protein
MSVCLSVCTAIGSAPGSATVLWAVSLEPLWPIMTRGVQREKKFPKIDHLAKLQKKKIYTTNAFQWENFIT